MSEPEAFGSHRRPLVGIWKKLWGKSKAKSGAEEWPTGICVWHDPPEPVVDIVFIHGLNGHREKTWQHDRAQKPWPKEFLADDLGHARLMGYGFDARVVAEWNEFLGKVSNNNIHQHAQNMLEKLALYRDEHSRERPIIFVCHSLGGIICKEALIAGRDWALEKHLAVLYRSTRGIVFLGTPHRGSSLADWAEKLARAVGVAKQTNARILDQLRAESKDLKSIQDNFDVLIRSRVSSKLQPIELKCFFEEKPLTGIGQVVDYESAILAGNIPIGISKDHREMTKFKSREDDGYETIRGTLARWLQEFGEQVHTANLSSPPPQTPQGSQAWYDGASTPRGEETPVSTSSPRSSSNISRSSFVKVPPGGKFILNENLVTLPRHFIPSKFSTRKYRYFQPRTEELTVIESVIFPSTIAPDDAASSAHRSFLITGLGGMGKTELAFRFVNQFKGKFDVIFFLVADSVSRLSEQYSDIAWELGLVEASDKNNEELRSETFRTWLGDPVKGAPGSPESAISVKWLLVFDNAGSADVLDRFLPAGGQGSILVTSRNPLLASDELSITGKLQLRGLSVEDGAKLLKICAQDHGPNSSKTDDAAKSMARWVQGLPMAIVQLGQTIYGKHMSISQFLQTYPKPANLYQSLDTPYRGTNLITAWALDDLRDNHKDTFKLLCLIAMLDSEKIEQRTLVPRPVALDNEGYAIAIPEYIDIRAQLADTSLIDVDRGDGGIHVHRVVQEVAKYLMVRHNTAADMFKLAIDRLGEQWPFLNRNYKTGTATKSSRWEACRLTYPHVVHLMGLHDEFTGLKVHGLASLELAELLLEAVQYRLECGASHDATALLDAVERIYDNANAASPNFTDERARLYRGRIGLAVSSKNADELLHYAQLAWDIETNRHRTIGYATSILAVAYNDLATAWACHREWEKAIDRLKESKRIRENLPGFTKDKLFSPLYHLGLVYSHQGKYDEAKVVLNEAIQDWEDAFGPDDASSVRIAALFYARGNVKFGQAEFDDEFAAALLDHKEAVLRATKCAGSKNKTTLICKYQVARVSAKLGDYETARNLLDEILCNTLEKPPYQRDIARTAFLYAQSLTDPKDAIEAAKWLVKSLEIHNNLRPQHTRTQKTLTEGDIAQLIPYDYL